ncbi:MAPEG family protein [Jannaschia sp. 2305UL9-9]|uniref:MAPEG family protein n=1 Tax=Jannaschia sp. 2305UL9-9 TaxID=3121638 RepID=UPI003526CD49
MTTRFAMAVGLTTLPGAALAQSTAAIVEGQGIVSVADYGHALAAMSGWAILMLVLLFASAAGKARERTASGHPVRDYSDPAYRRSRAFLNAIEITGPFVAATLVCILVGASPAWTNALASVFLVSRIAMAAVHIGTEVQWLRSLFWGIGLLCVIGLAIIGLIGAFAA